MIPEYKLYHGAVLAELVHRHPKGLCIDELIEEGRLSSYVLDGSIGLQVKHSTQKLYPWQFTFTKSNLVELLALRQRYKSVFVVLVCHTDGMVCLTIEEATAILAAGETDQAWIRVERRKGEWYAVWGGGAELPNKKPNGLDLLLEALA